MKRLFFIFASLLSLSVSASAVPCRLYYSFTGLQIGCHYQYFFDVYDRATRNYVSDSFEFVADSTTYEKFRYVDWNTGVNCSFGIVGWAWSLPDQTDASYFETGRTVTFEIGVPVIVPVPSDNGFFSFALSVEPLVNIPSTVFFISNLLKYIEKF